MIKIGVIMDPPIARIRIRTDSSFGILLAAQHHGYENYYLEPQDVWLQNQEVWGRTRKITVFDDADNWFKLEEPIIQPLTNLNIVFQRKDPPFNIDYLHLTYILEIAEAHGLLVVNRSSSVRNANEKLFAARFPDLWTKTCVTSNSQLLREFVAQEKKAVFKPIDNMAGNSIFLARDDDLNLGVIIETLTDNGRRLVMAQRYIPEIENLGDKRIILIDGQPVAPAILRKQVKGDFRATVARGGGWEPAELSVREQAICQQIAPTLRELGLLFVGLDVIGGYVTEMNVTSPTGARLLDANLGVNICEQVLECAVKHWQIAKADHF